MINKLSSVITAGQREQLQRFLDRYGEEKPQSGFNAFSKAKSNNPYGLSKLTDVLNSYAVHSNNDKFSLENIENTAYGKHLDAVFNPALLVDSEVDGVKVKIKADIWQKDVEIKLSDVAERILKLGNGNNDENDL